MPIKIIKPNSAQAAHIRPFSVGLNSGDPPKSRVEIPEWLKVQERIPRASTAPPQAAPPPSELQQPAIDMAQVEKTAYENGFLQGEKAGMAIAEKKVEVSMRRYAEAIVAIGKLRSQLYAQVEREVVKLAIEVAKKIVHREVQVDRDIIQTLVKVALSHVADKSAVTVHLHPVDYNYLLEHRAELTRGADDGRDIVLLADKSIDRGGCLIETECGDIDARIEEEFRELERSFFEGLKPDGK